MGHAASAEKRVRARMRTIDELIDQDEGAGRQFLLERAAGGERNEIGHAGTLENVNIGAVIDVARRKSMAFVVARQECDR